MGITTRSAFLPLLALSLLVASCGADSPEAVTVEAASSVVEPEAPDQPCEPGTWSSTGMRSAPGGCVVAAAGSFVAEAGARGATPCPPGSYAANARARSCLAAPAGSFVAEQGATSATLCPAGSFAAEKGQTACEPAPPGSHVPSKGMSFAAACPQATGEGTIWCVPDLPQRPSPGAPRPAAPTPPAITTAPGECPSPVTDPEGFQRCLDDRLAGIGQVPATPTAPAPQAPPAELRSTGVPYTGNDGLIVTVSSITVTERPGSLIYTVVYRLENTTASAIDEGSFKLFGDASSLPQYGFFSRMFSTDVIERTAVFEEERSKPLRYLSYHSDQFFAASPPRGALVWAVPLP